MSWTDLRVHFRNVLPREAPPLGLLVEDVRDEKLTTAALTTTAATTCATTFVKIVDERSMSCLLYTRPES